MRRLLVSVWLLVLIVPASVSAAPVRDCGNFGFVEGSSRQTFTHREIEGAGVYNITVRVTSCAAARKMVRRFHTGSSSPCSGRTPCRVDGYTCRRTQLGEEYADQRCTGAAGRVIRWQYGA